MTVIMMMMMMMMEMVTSTPDLTMFPSSLIAGTHGPVRGIDRVAGNGAGQPSDAAAITVLTPDTGYKHTRSTQTILLYLSLNKGTSKDTKLALRSPQQHHMPQQLLKQLQSSKNYQICMTLQHEINGISNSNSNNSHHWIHIWLGISTKMSPHPDPAAGPCMSVTLTAPRCPRESEQQTPLVCSYDTSAIYP